MSSLNFCCFLLFFKPKVWLFSGSLLVWWVQTDREYPQWKMIQFVAIVSFKLFFHMGNRLSPSFEWKQRKLLAGTWQTLGLEKRRQSIQIIYKLLTVLLVIYSMRRNISHHDIFIFRDISQFPTRKMSKRQQVNERLCTSCILRTDCLRQK
jgi:hypothetical protein